MARATKRATERLNRGLQVAGVLWIRREPRATPATMRFGLPSLATGLLLTLSCAGGGQYGYARAYSALDEEATALEGSETYDPVMARRLPQEWQTKRLNLFGVVVSRKAAANGKTDVLLSVRHLAARNLCESGEEDSCRVTVGDNEITRIHARLTLAQGDTVGKTNLKPRSLLRVVGKLQQEVDRKDGSNVIEAEFYRHWPPGFYVTNQAREYMRR